MEWKQIHTAPLDRDLETAVIDTKGTHLVAFPCRRLVDDRWIDVETSFTTSARRIGGIGCLTSPARRYVEPDQCFKLIVAFVTDPGVTNVIALEKLRIFWAGAPPEWPEASRLFDTVQASAG